MSVYQWLGSNNADLANEGNWVNTSNPGTVATPGTNDVAIIQVGQGLYGVIDVDALDIVQASGAPPISITGSSTQVTAASVGIGYGFDLDKGAYLQAGELGIDGDGTAVTVQNNAYLYDLSSAENDVLTIGAGAGNSSVLVTKGGTFAYNSDEATGTLDLGGTLNSVATLTISADGYFSSELNSFNVGAASGSTGYLNVTGAGSQFLMDNYGYTTVGDFGERGGSAQGTITVTAGAYASLSSYGEMDIGTSAGMAKVLVSGANSAIEAGPYVEVGEYQSNIAGEILVQAGGEFDTATDLFLNNGALGVSGAHSLYTGRILSVDNGATVTVATGGFIHVTDVELGGRFVLNAGSVDARAGFYLYGGSLVIGAGTLTATTIGNAGAINASGGTLVINGAISGTGTEAMFAHATLELDGPVVSTQTIAFNGANTVLKLDKPASFKGRITKFAAGDEIDLTSVAFKTGATATFSGNKLTLHDGTYTAIFNAGPSDATRYSVSGDGHGGTEITVATGAARVVAFTQATASFGRGASSPDLVPAFAGEGATLGDTRIATPSATLRHAV